MTRGTSPATPLRPKLDPGDDLLAQCIACGLCLPACPTYERTPFERANPRGRIRLMRAVADGEMDAGDPAFGDAMAYCVGCRACETACPAGVEFGRLLQAAREAAVDAGDPRRRRHRAVDWLLDEVVGSPRRLRWAARLLRLYRRTLGRWAPAREWIDERWPDLTALEAAAPATVPPPSTAWRLPAVVEPGDAVEGDRAPSARGTVALHPGCLQSVLLPGVNGDTAQVLAYNAWRVVLPDGFRCCGALHAHQGRLDEARALARRNVAAFDASDAVRLVSNAAGCGAFFEEYGSLLADDPAWSEAATRLSAAVVDVCEHLVADGVRKPRRPFHLTVTYHDPCHLIHGQRIAEAPRLLLGAIPGLEVVPLPESTRCCGSAGVYNLTHPEASNDMMRRKVTNVAETGAELVVTGNAGCMVQIARGLGEVGSPVRVLHPISLLRAAYELPSFLPR
ncbi:MAG: (Fe-S)-binding protein [Gemmatimonadota bacterium]|nr:(Fe-S)-binding protein [Gemmatimonadota bacterium]